ncbi:hypothetical protein GCM10010488_21400 [Oerskovia jenensis]
MGAREAQFYESMLREHREAVDAGGRAYLVSAADAGVGESGGVSGQECGALRSIGEIVKQSGGIAASDSVVVDEQPAGVFASFLATSGALEILGFRPVYDSSLYVGAGAADELGLGPDHRVNIAGRSSSVSLGSASPRAESASRAIVFVEVGSAVQGQCLVEFSRDIDRALASVILSTEFTGPVIVAPLTDVAVPDLESVQAGRPDRLLWLAPAVFFSLVTALMLRMRSRELALYSTCGAPRVGLVVIGAAEAALTILPSLASTLLTIHHVADGSLVALQQALLRGGASYLACLALVVLVASLTVPRNGREFDLLRRSE